MDTGVDLSTARDILKSEKTEYTYYLFPKELYVCNADGDIVKRFEMPKDPRNGTLVGFYTLYYTSAGLRVIFSAFGSYDVAYILNEDDLTLTRQGFDK